jgi:hypothetical protein
VTTNVDPLIWTIRSFESALSESHRIESRESRPTWIAVFARLMNCWGCAMSCEESPLSFEHFCAFWWISILPNKLDLLSGCDSLVDWPYVLVIIFDALDTLTKSSMFYLIDN